MAALVLANAITHWIKSVSGPWLYIVTFLLTFAETGTMLFFVPGEFTLIFAGIAAGAGGINVVVVLIVGWLAAIAGDAFGFFIGKRYGRKLRTSRLGKKLGEDNWTRAEDLITRRKGIIVLVGRWVGFLRAVMPATAGMTGMHYKRDFLPFDVAGAVSWATVCVLGGYLLGDRAEAIVQKIGWIAGAAAVVAIAYLLVQRRRKSATRSSTTAGHD